MKQEYRWISTEFLLESYVFRLSKNILANRIGGQTMI